MTLFKQFVTRNNIKICRRKNVNQALHSVVPHHRYSRKRIREAVSTSWKYFRDVEEDGAVVLSSAIKCLLG